MRALLGDKKAQLIRLVPWKPYIDQGYPHE
jgi:hypothetical protein